MKNNSHMLHPYPMLTSDLNTTDYKNCRFIVDFDYECDDKKGVFSISGKVTVDSNLHETFIERGLLKCWVVIDCPQTRWRRSYEITPDLFDAFMITLPYASLNGDINIKFYLIPADDLNVVGDSVTPKYNMKNYTLPKWAEVAYTDLVTITLVKKRDGTEPKDISALVKIIPDHNTEYVFYDADNEDIYIHAPVDMLAVINNLGGKAKNNAQMILCGQALPLIISTIQTDIQESVDSDDYTEASCRWSNRCWFHSLNDLFVERGYTDGFKDKTFISEDPGVLYQKLMKDPVGKSVTELKDLCKEAEGICQMSMEVL